MQVNAFGFIPTRQVSFSNQEVQLQTALVRKIKHYLKLSLARSGKKPSPFSSTFNSFTPIAFPLRKMKGGRQTERPAERERQEKHRQAKTQTNRNMLCLLSCITQAVHRSSDSLSLQGSVHRLNDHYLNRAQVHDYSSSNSRWTPYDF
jgi:hypothetical protein